jgi:ribosomal protein S27E
MNTAWSLCPYKHFLPKQNAPAASPAAPAASAARHKRPRLATPYRAQAGELFETHKARGLRFYCPACKQEHTFAADARLQCPTCGKTHLEGLSPTQLERHQDLPPPRPKLSAR